MTALQMKRRHFLWATLAIISSARAARAEPRRFRVAFANLNEEPGARIDGLGFTGAEVRRSFELASRALPLDIIYYDNGGDAEKALLLALADVMRAHGVGAVASRVGLQRTNVRRAMSGKTDPHRRTVLKMLGSARLSLSVKPAPRSMPRQRKRA